MSLFIKKSEIGSNNVPLYTTGNNKTVLVVGLGNVGKEYDGTRHNVGFACVDVFAASQDFPSWTDKKDLKCHVARQTIGSTSVILIKPTTLMNNSGEAVRAVQHFYKIANASTLVVHDELDIPFGQIRLRVGGSAAGNNGIKSIIQHCGEDFGRVRVGIGNEFSDKADSADFVLGKFTKDEQDKLSKLTREVSAYLSEYTASGQVSAETRSFLA